MLSPRFNVNFIGRFLTNDDKNFNKIEDEKISSSPNKGKRNI